MKIRWQKFIQSGFRMPFYMHLYLDGMHKELQRLLGWHMESGLVVIERQLNTVYDDPASISDFEKFIKSKVKSKIFRNNFVKTFAETDVELLKFCRKIYFRDLDKESLETLGKLLGTFA